MIILIEAICSFFACLFFAIIYNTPKKELFYVGFAGAVGYAIFFTFDRYAGLNAAGTFLGSAAICIMAKYFSASHTMPKLLYVLPAIYPLVPGAGIYYAMHDIMIGDFASATNDIILTTNTGGITVSNVLAKNLSVTVSTGKVNLRDVNCTTLISSGNTGDISLKNTIVRDTLTITRSTGDVKLENSDAENIFIQTDTGDITGTLKTEKVFTTNTSTGKIDIPKTSNGGKCNLETSTGNIKIRIN